MLFAKGTVSPYNSMKCLISRAAPDDLSFASLVDIGKASSILSLRETSTTAEQCEQCFHLDSLYPTMEDFLPSILLCEQQIAGASELIATGSPIEQTYYPLNIARKEIRLIRVQPNIAAGKRQLRLECDLVTVSLDDRPRFDALSYTWGGDPRTIRINGRRVKVTTSVWGALTVFRETNVLPAGYVWVDAICINQEDTEERGS